MSSAAGDARTEDPEISIRSIGEDDLEAWGRTFRTTFLMGQHPETLKWLKHVFVPGRSSGAYDGERCVGTFRSIPFEITVPGGASLPASGISNVAVLGTHRRRGLLTRMMDRDLRAAADRGEAVAILVAAEYAIYGRFGFGPATVNGGYDIDLARSGGLREGVGTGHGGRIDFAELDEVRRVAPELHERFRSTRPGAITRPEWSWQLRTGEVSRPGEPFKEPITVLFREADGTVTGLLSYQADGEWTAGEPNSTLSIVDHLAVNPAAAAALWRHAFSVDWVRRITVRSIAPDDPLPLLLVNPRAARPTAGTADMVWLRVLDLPTAFAARRYGMPGRIVIRVRDSAGYTEGRWRLETSEDGSGKVVRLEADGDGDGAEGESSADLAMDASQLGTLYLGSETVSRLVAAGLVQELRPGAAARADLMLRTPVAPWCPDMF